MDSARQPNVIRKWAVSLQTPSSVSLKDGVLFAAVAFLLFRKLMKSSGLSEVTWAIGAQIACSFLAGLLGARKRSKLLSYQLYPDAGGLHLTQGDQNIGPIFVRAFGNQRIAWKDLIEYKAAMVLQDGQTRQAIKIKVATGEMTFLCDDALALVSAIGEVRSLNSGNW